MIAIKHVESLQTELDERLSKNHDLDDLKDVSKARDNLGLGSLATKNVTVSTSAPSGGSNGDIWFRYEN